MQNSKCKMQNAKCKMQNDCVREADVFQIISEGITFILHSAFDRQVTYTTIYLPEFMPGFGGGIPYARN